jgi:Tol biopolymer transport system component
LDLVTGVFTTVVELPFARSDGRVSVVREFESVGDAETLRWFVRCSSWDRTGVPSEEIVWGPESQMHSRVVNRGPQGAAEYAQLNRDGSAIVIIKTSGGNEAIDIETGLPIEKPGPDVLAWAPETSQSSIVPMSPGVANVSDLNDSSKTYQLKTSTAIGMGYSSPVSSADGRWIAGLGDRSVTSRWHQILTGKAETLEGEIRIWRLPDSAAAPASSPK